MTANSRIWFSTKEQEKNVNKHVFQTLCFPSCRYFVFYTKPFLSQKWFDQLYWSSQTAVQYIDAFLRSYKFFHVVIFQNGTHNNMWSHVFIAAKYL